MKVFFFALVSTLVVSASGAACGTSLDKADCDKCTEGTHLFVCSTCHQCTSDTAACSSDCSGNGFVTDGTKCKKCPAIANCPRAEISCAVASGAVTATSADCGNCAAGFEKVAKVASGTLAAAKCVAKIAIDNCKTLGACTIDSGACKANTQDCTLCNDGFMRVAKVTGASPANAKCVAKIAIDNCKTLGDCTVASGASACTANTQECAVCNAGFEEAAKVTGASPANGKCVAKIAITNCKTLGDCTVASGASACTANTQACTECNEGFMKVARVTGASPANAKCVAKIAITNCKELGDCTVASGASACTANTQACTECNTGFHKVAKVTGASPANAKCVAKIAIDNCKELGACTVASGASACTANTQACTKCNTGFHKVAKVTGASPANARCVTQIAIANCEELGACTAAAGATACTANTQDCATCKLGFKKVAKVTGASPANAKCEACASTSAACASGCAAAQGAYTDGTTCKICGEETTAANCVSTKCAQLYKFAWGKCRRNLASNAIAGRLSSDIDTSAACSEFQSPSANPQWTYKTCTQAYVTGDVKTCTTCTETACSAGTCKTSTNEFKSGKCTAKSTGGGGNTGKTNNTNNTNTSSFGMKVEQSIVGLIAVLAFIC